MIKEKTLTVYLVSGEIISHTGEIQASPYPDPKPIFTAERHKSEPPDIKENYKKYNIKHKIENKQFYIYYNIMKELDFTQEIRAQLEAERATQKKSPRNPGQPKKKKGKKLNKPFRTPGGPRNFLYM